jgi:hypothetical protein
VLKNFRDKVTFSGITVLMLGVGVLVATFISAYGFLSQSLSLLGSSDLVGIFGESLAPLIATVIRIMYLGVMGWIGSLLTIRGVTLILNAPKTEIVVPQKTIVQQPKPVPAPQKAKPEAKPSPPQPEAKPSEPEFIVIPPEEVAQPPPKEQEKQPQQQNGSSPPQTPSQ